MIWKIVCLVNRLYLTKNSGPAVPFLGFAAIPKLGVAVWNVVMHLRLLKFKIVDFSLVQTQHCRAVLFHELLKIASLNGS